MLIRSRAGGSRRHHCIKGHLRLSFAPLFRIFPITLFIPVSKLALSSCMPRTKGLGWKHNSNMPPRRRKLSKSRNPAAKTILTGKVSSKKAKTALLTQNDPQRAASSTAKSQKNVPEEQSSDEEASLSRPILRDTRTRTRTLRGVSGQSEVEEQEE